MQVCKSHLYKAISFLFAWIIILSFFSCKSEASGETKPKESLDNAVDQPLVEIMELTKGPFYREMISNGKLYALQKTELRFKINETINKIFVKNGDRVQRGALIATLDPFTFRNNLNRIRTSFDKAEVDLKDVLIGQGFNTDDLSKIPVTTLKMSKIKCGYDNALCDLEYAEHNYQNTFLKAPFSGVICNLKARENSQPGSDPICILVDNSCFEAEFSVLESELGIVAKGQKVEIIPFANEENIHHGMITEINPLIAENGLVTVKARVDNAHQSLYEGMNVRVILKEAFTDCLVVPKQAVVLRTGKEVLFTYQNGMAKWHYVKTIDENSTSYVITGDIQAGEKVIISGNLNLGSDAKVLLK